MAETKHSPEPWRATLDPAKPERDTLVRDRSGCIVAVRHMARGAEHAANCRRIVACVNACADIPTEALESGALAKALDALCWLTNPGRDGREDCQAQLAALEALRALGRLK